MNVPVGGVRDACFHQNRVGYSRIELPGEVAGDMPAKKRRGIANNDRGSIHGADDRACCRRFRVDQYRCDRMGELSGLAAGFDISPFCPVMAGTRTASTISPGCSADSSAPVIKSSIARLRVPAGLRSVTFAPSAANAEIQSAAGSA